MNSVCVRHDAISSSVRNEVAWLSDSGRNTVRLFAYACDADEVPHRTVRQIGDVAFDPHFQASDLVVFHFGIFYPLFDLLPLVPAGAVRVVVFHNVTPRALVPAAQHELIDRSHRQTSNMAFADRILCDSPTNASALAGLGITVPSQVVPLAVDMPHAAPRSKPSATDGVVRLAFVGRFVRSKGPVDLLSAVARLLQREPVLRIDVALVGNIGFSDPATLQAVREAIDGLHAAYGDRATIALHGDASDATKQDLLADADLFVLPTYHEGFCVPVLEALSHGCRVITYDNSNLPFVTGGLATLVATGDLVQLTDALQHASNVVRDAAPDAIDGAPASDAYAARVRAHLRQFAPPVVRSRFLEAIDAAVCSRRAR